MGLGVESTWMGGAGNGSDAGRRGGSVVPMAFNLQGLTGGHYAASFIGGSLSGALTAPNQVGTIRWGSPTKYMIPLRLSIQVLCTAFSTGISLDFALYKATQITSNSSGSGSTTVTNPSKMRSGSMNQSEFTSFGELRWVGTAALTAGTQTLDAAPITYAVAKLTAVQDAPALDMYVVGAGKYPVVLGVNEGLILRLESLNLPASNTLKIYGNLEWVEVAGVPF